MKDFNITRDFSVTILDSSKPLPKNVCYGRLGNVTYVMFPKSLKIEAYYGTYKRPVKKEAILNNIANVCSKHLREWESLPAPEYCTYENKRREREFKARIKELREEERAINSLLPHMRQPQKYTPSDRLYSQSCVDGWSLRDGGTLEEKKRGFTDDDYKYGYNGLPVIDGGETVHYTRTQNEDKFTPVGTSHKDRLYYGKRFDVGQDTAGRVAFLTKRDGLKVLDKTHGKSEGKEKFKVALPEHSVSKRQRSEEELREEAARLMAARSQSFKTLGWKE